MLPQLDPAAMTWTIAGWQQPKIVALLESLPKAQRKPLAPLDPLAHELASALPPFEGALLPALERAIFERTGERVARSAWDLRTVPQYLSFNYRVVDERDKVLATGRDLEELQTALGQRAREVWAAAPRERYERTGLRAWDFAELAESVTIDVGGRRMLAYPALVDRESTVDLRLLESPAAAIAATRDGLRRLALFASAQSYGKLEALLPAPLAKDVRRQLVVRALDDAFDLAEPPRDKATFDRRIAAGRGVLPAIVVELGRTAQAYSAELDKVRAAVKPLAGKPGLARAVFEDVQSQLAHLAPPDLWTAAPARLDHRLRYLKALQVRLQRQAHDPQKDQTKAVQVVPLWAAFVARRAELLAKGRTARELDDFGWLLEELRVQVFAPELKTAVPVSLPRVQEQWSSLAR
jgi:ATP-dependent helicase HrpA